MMILAALLILALIYSEKVFMGVAFLFGITSPFLVGGAMAFVLNIPMRGFEEKVFGRWKGRAAAGAFGLCRQRARRWSFRFCPDRCRPRRHF